MRYLILLQALFLVGCAEYRIVREEVPVPVLMVWLDPCPEIHSDFPEVLLLFDETFYAVYYDHKKKRSHLAEIPPGTYRTTDDREARFEVLKGGELQCLD